MAVQWKLSGDYYVDGISGDDGNAGTSTAPFKTIGAAAAVIANYEKIVVGAGVYNESINYNAKINVYTCADGNAIIDCTGLTSAANYKNRGGYFEDMTFINGGSGGIENGVTYYYKSWYTRCTFQDCTFFWTGNSYYGVNYRVVHLKCKYINFSTGVKPESSYYINVVDFDSCIFWNAPVLVSQQGAYSANSWGSNIHNCWLDGDWINDDGERPLAYIRGIYTGYTIDKCFIGPGGQIESSTAFSGVKTPAEANAASPGFFFPNGYLQATASYNTTISGSGMIEATAYSITSGNNTEIYSSRLQPSFSYLATQSPTTAFGYQDDANNILSTAGGATWANITSSGDSLQISSSAAGPTGSITSTTVNLGGIQPIDSIRSSWTTQVANACAPAVYSSSILNQYPSRYTFEMKYGNASDLSSEPWKIYCFDEQPYVSSNGSGSGDIGFLTASYSSIDA